MNDNALTATKLIAVLWPEAFQAEESARAHPAREGKRFGSSAPAAAMLAVSRHAGQSLSSLNRLAVARGHRTSKVGMLFGQALSVLRTFGSDRLVSSEKSYRGTVLGIHHGIGVIALLEDAATATGDAELADFCHTWLAERRVLCGACEEALAWFAEHPEVAASRASSKVGIVDAQPAARANE